MSEERDTGILRYGFPDRPAGDSYTFAATKAIEAAIRRQKLAAETFLPPAPKRTPITGSPNPGPRNGRCPLCDSGLSYKRCHGAPPTQDDYDRQKLALAASAAFTTVLQESA